MYRLIRTILLLAALAALSSAGRAEEAAEKPADPDVNPCAGMAEGEVMGVEACEECHPSYVEGMRMNPHGQSADSRTPFARDECETCHGPGTTHFDVEGNCIISQRGRFGEPVEQRNGICLQCHQGSSRMHWPGSTHQANDIACADCHHMHGGADVTSRQEQAQVCYGCHAEVRASNHQPYGHPIREQQVLCSDCHNPHGSTGPSEVKSTSINDTCYECHAEKRGPYLWEHFPVTEDCTLCHAVHGSIHRGALKARPPHLCQECHMQYIGRNHVRELYDYDLSPDLVVSRGLLTHGCSNCHSQVHGSNHPSGASLMR